MDDYFPLFSINPNGPLISEALYRICSFHYSFVMASIVKDKPLHKLRRRRKWHTKWYLFMITFVMKRWVCTNEWHYIVTALLDCPDCMMNYCSWKFTKIHQNSSNEGVTISRKWLKIHQSSSKFMKSTSTFIIFHEISSWNFMNCPTRCLCQFNIVHFHEIRGLFSSTFMKFHEVSWIFSAGYIFENNSWLNTHVLIFNWTSSNPWLTIVNKSCKIDKNMSCLQISTHIHYDYKANCKSF